MRTHQLPESGFQEICAGPASPDSIDILRKTQHSVRFARLGALLDLISTLPEYKRAVDILVEVDEVQPELSIEVLAHPPAGVWLVRALRSESELAYLNSLAAALAIRAGLSFEVEVPVDNGFARLPTVGVAPFPGATTVSLDSVPADLIPAVRHRAESNGLVLDLLIDDRDPYREFGEPLPAIPLSADEMAGWRELLDEAWRILAERHVGYAKELSVGLSTIVPITAGRHVAGGSSRAAFGGLVLSTKGSAAELADVLVHELQHSKLNAVLDLVPLTEGDSGERWYAPWRTDPRPLVGVLHGIYAFTSVVEFWQVERHHVDDPDGREAATFAFAYRRRQVREAIEDVRSAGELTQFGRQLVEAADKRISIAETADVPARILAAVTEKAELDRMTWSRAHGS